MCGRRQGSCQIIRFAWVIVCLAAGVVVHPADAEAIQNSVREHAASSCEVDESRNGECVITLGEDNTIGAETNRHHHATQHTGDGPEDHALLLIDYYKRLDRPHLSLAGWQKVGTRDSL